ncbi:minor capsid protein [Leuconostoc pseudomesenteroides]|uniref:minor capsid protein n=1 Tax=Leuconostoc pseudomesenteroides TaxID=33968 RepID=UPI0021A7A7E0|nr:minor capsid protein [Leuconostoc pseudomesenteroides]MCT4379984.1 phage head morphogenesis protein [Leuconostoc pseudomesenteroides]
MTDSYWEKRTKAIMDLLDVKDTELTNAVLKEYQAASDDISRKIDDFYEKYADKNTISYDEARKRVRAVDLDDYVKRANAYRKSNKDNPELLKRLNAQYMTSKISRLELLKLEIDFRILQASNAQSETFTAYLAKESAYIYSALSVGNAVKTLNEREIESILQMEWSGASYSQRIWRDNDVLANKLKDELVKAAINGTNPRVTAKKLRDTFGGTKPNTERLVRTESTYVANASTAKRYDNMGVKEYEFVAVLDRRTSSICREMNGQTFPLSEFMPGTNAPAMHPNCRSTIVPAASNLTKYNKYLDSDTVDDLPDMDWDF